MLRGKGSGPRESLSFVDTRGFETLPRYFCLGDTREMVYLLSLSFLIGKMVVVVPAPQGVGGLGRGCLTKQALGKE